MSGPPFKSRASIDLSAASGWSARTWVGGNVTESPPAASIPWTYPAQEQVDVDVAPRAEAGDPRIQHGADPDGIQGLPHVHNVSDSWESSSFFETFEWIRNPTIPAVA